MRDPLRRVLGPLNPASFRRPLRELGLFRNCRTVNDVRDVMREQVEAEVAAMLGLVADDDAFDVIELMRMREFPPVPDPRVVVADGTALAVELVSAVLLSRESRKPGSTPRLDTRPHERVGELHERAQRLSRLATYGHQLEARLSQDPLARIAAEYRSAVLNIRNMQYDTVRDDHETQLLDHPTVTEMMRTHLGYTYADVLGVRDAMHQISGDRMTKLRDDSGAILMRYPNTAPKDVPATEVQAFMNLMIPFIFLPADRAVITATEVAAEANLDVETAQAVLDSYSQTFDDSQPAGKRVYDVLVGENPFLLTPLISDGSGNFVATTNDVGLDSLRRIFEAGLPQNSDEVRRYDKKVRQVVTERLALQHLETILGTPPAREGFEYFAPLVDSDHTALGADCAELNRVAKQVEGDGLFLIEDVAICVEVKGKSMAAQARRGDVRRLSRDLKATIGDAAGQAARLQSLIETNGGLWLGNRTWLDLSHIREVRSVVALLDDIGPLGTAIGELQRVGIVPEQRPPWITSLHDLATIAEVCDRPGEFLLYLRRRTDSGVTTHYRAADELDLYMLFLEGGLYVEPDPEQIKAEHPAVPPVKKRDQRQHADDAVGTLVVDHCAELNAWMQRHQIEEHNEQPTKPAFNTASELAPLIDALYEQRAPGWLRSTADLLGLSGETQRRIHKAIAECARMTRKDGQYHEVMLSFAGLWGHPTLFAATRPSAAEPEVVQWRLQTYMRAKRYQLSSDRALGLVFDGRCNIEQVIYLNAPHADSPELDALVEAMQLQPTGDKSPRPIPPSAQRSTRRLRGKRRKR
ncbi:hypothetical protein [Nocardioides sp. LHG3406-4]|uniref:hypothetical protein n=1 Tax=Nocardioides sp. LHG3406-4 TaxID=2804575 RepID=UPI003CEB2EE4